VRSRDRSGSLTASFGRRLRNVMETLNSFRVSAGHDDPRANQARRRL